MERQARYQYSNNNHTAQIVKISKVLMKSVHTGDYNKQTQRVDNEDSHMAKYPFAKKLKKWKIRCSCTYCVPHATHTDTHTHTHYIECAILEVYYAISSRL